MIPMLQHILPWIVTRDCDITSTPEYTLLSSTVDTISVNVQGIIQSTTKCNIPRVTESIRYTSVICRPDVYTFRFEDALMAPQLCPISTIHHYIGQRRVFLLVAPVF